MHVQGAEAPGKVLVLFGRELLVAKEEHEMIEEGVVDLRERLVVEFIREIDVEDLGAQGAGDGLNDDSVVAFTHGRLLHDAACERHPQCRRFCLPAIR